MEALRANQSAEKRRNRKLNTVWAHMGGRALNPQKPGKPVRKDTAKATGHPVGTVSNLSDETSAGWQQELLSGDVGQGN